MSRFLSSFRFRLILLVLLAVLPTLGLTLYTGVEARQTAAAVAQHDALQLTVLASADQDSLVESTRQLLMGLARLPQVRQGDAAACSTLFANLLEENPRYANLGVAKPNGDLWCSAVPMSSPTNYANRAWYPEVMRTRDFAAGGYTMGTLTRKPLSTFAYPVLDDARQIQGIVIAGVDLAWLNQFVARTELPPGSVLTVIDETGVVLARSVEPQKWVGKQADAPIVKIILERKGQGTVESIDLDGVNRLYAFTQLGSQLQAGNVYVYIGIPVEVAFAQADQTLTRNLIALGVVFVLAFAASWVIGDLSIVRHVNALAHATQRLAAGDLSARTDTRSGVSELSQLARAFNGMAASLQQRERERKQTEEELTIANRELVYQNEEKEQRAAELVLANKELAFQNEEKEQRAAELVLANKELAFQNEEKEQRAAELVLANKELAFQNEEKEQRAAELVLANKELAFQNEEKEQRAAELVLANKELAFQNEEKEQRAAELVLANKELAFQNEEKEQRAAELVLANKELAFQNEEKEQRAAELVLANKELAFQNEEKEQRAAELVLANKELAFQNEEKEQRAAELVLANKELAFQNEEKEQRAAELVLANKELAFQNEEKEQRAAELVLANKELAFQNEEKEQRAAELVLANKELAFQNEEKEQRAAELVLANKELAFQNEEKEQRAAELVLANKELAFQNEEKEKRAAELVLANKELAFQNEEKEKRAAELVLANEATVRRLQNIQALHKIDQAVAGSLDLNLTLNVVLEQVKTQLNIDAAAVLLLDPHTQILEFSSGLGFRSKAIERSRLRLGEGHGGHAALERRTVSVTDLLENSTQFDRALLLADEGFATYFGTPLIAKGQVNGVLEVFHRSPFTPDDNWLEFFRILAGQAAIAVDSASLFTELRHSNAQLFAAYDSTIEGWSHALDLRDKETEGHSLRVTEMTLQLARAMGMSEEETVHVRRGALLHDIGKMGVPDSVLLKPDKLTDEEWVQMRRHPQFAYDMLSPIAYLKPALDIPYCHHEKWDGTGYPRGLKGEQIPLAARLFAVVDVWDALTSDRPYRVAWSKEKTREYIKAGAGSHFDPQVVKVFLRTETNK